MKKFANIAVGLASILTVGGCSAFGVINAASSSEHYDRHTDLAYGEHARQKLDIYVPRTGKSLAPVVVFFYGGGWQRGAKENYEFVASSLTERGYVVVIPDYRLHPEVTYPAFVEDGVAALHWTTRQIAEHGGDRDAVFVMGHSAGAHIAAMTVLDEQYMNASEPDIAGFIGLSGPYDFLPIRQGYLLDVFPEPTREHSQPINHVGSHAPPTLLIHGGDDSVVQIGNSERFAGRLKAAGVPVDLKLYGGIGHARVVAALAPPLDFIASTLDDATQFMESVRNN